MPSLRPSPLKRGDKRGELSRKGRKPLKCTQHAGEGTEGPREGGSCNTSFHKFRAEAAAMEEGVLCAHAAAAVPPRKSSQSGTVAGAAAAGGGGWAP